MSNLLNRSVKLLKIGFGVLVRYKDKRLRRYFIQSTYLKEMAYPTFISSLYVLISLFLMIACTSHCFELNNVSEDHYEKVNLTLYYETLCPGCEGFIVNDLVRVFNTDLKSIVNLHLVPFGNANVTGSNKTVTCQVSLNP